MTENTVPLTKDNLRQCLSVYEQSAPTLVKEAESYLHSWTKNPDLPGLLWQVFEDSTQVNVILIALIFSR